MVRIHRYKTSELLYYIAYILYIVFGILRSSFYALYITDGFVKVIFLICSSMLCISMFVSKKTTIKNLIVLVIIVILIGIVTLSSNSERRRDLIALLLFVFFGKKIKFEKIAKLTIILDISLLFFVVFSSKLGIIPEYTVVQGTRTRSFLGFLYALYAPTLWCNGTFLFIYLKREKIKYTELIVLIVISYLLYAEALSRLTFFLCIVMIFFSLLQKHELLNFLKKKTIKIIMCLSFPLSCAISLYLAMNYNPSYYSLNVALEGRISSAYSAINKYGIHLLGQPIQWVGNGVNAYGNVSIYQYNYVDNLYVQILIQYGIVFLLIVGLCYLFLHVRLCKNDEVFLALIMSLLALHGLIDDLIIYLIYNTFWIVFFSKVDYSVQ